MTVDIVHQKALCVFMNVVVAFWMYCKTVRMPLYGKIDVVFTPSVTPTQSCVTTCDQFKNKQHLRLKKVWVFQFCLLCSSRVLRDYKKTGASGHMLKLNVCERVWEYERTVHVCLCLTQDSTAKFCMSCNVTAASIQTAHDVHSHTHSLPVHRSRIFLPHFSHSFLSLNPFHSASPYFPSYSFHLFSVKTPQVDRCDAIWIHTWENVTLARRVIEHVQNKEGRGWIYVISQHRL